MKKTSSEGNMGASVLSSSTIVTVEGPVGCSLSLSPINIFNSLQSLNIL